MLTCLDEEREDFHNGVPEPVLGNQHKDMVAGAQGRGVELKLPVTCRERERGRERETSDSLYVKFLHDAAGSRDT